MPEAAKCLVKDLRGRMVYAEPISPRSHTPSPVGVDIPSCGISMGWISAEQARIELDGARLSQRTKAPQHFILSEQVQRTR